MSIHNCSESESLESILKKSLEDHKLKVHYKPEYGDLVSLDKEGLILKAVGRELLEKTVSEYLGLLDTSGAIYEKNGDYALGIFSSGWCQIMDLASRKLCKTKNNKEALDSGKWRCHESCWGMSKVSIETKMPVDIECSGGIRLYAVPILVDDEAVGSINFGYGSPPKNHKELKALSQEYKININILKKASEEYRDRPELIIMLAKRRIESAAEFIASIVKAYMAEKQISDLARFPGENTSPVLRITKSGVLMYINQAGLNLFGKHWNHEIGKQMPENFNKLLKENNNENKDKRNEFIFGDHCFSFKAIPIQGKEYINVYAEDITEQQKLEKKIAKNTHNLGERVKELNCLYEISKLIETPGITLQKIYQGIIDLIPPAWQYPESVCARLIIGNNEFTSAHFSKSQFKQEAKIILRGEKKGIIQVFLSEKEQIFSKSFLLKEERNLLHAIAERLGKVIERMNAAEEIKKTHENLKKHVSSERLAYTGRVASGIAHEIRNPSTNVSLALEQLCEAFEPHDKQMKYVEIMERNLMRINYLISELLNCARPPEMMVKPHDIHKLLKNVINLVDAKISAKEVNVVRNYTSRSSIVKLDREHIERVFVNLVLNAIEAITRKRGTITVTTERDGKYFLVKIQDTGKGIAPENIFRIFDPFFSSKPNGVGLGLATCYGVIVSHGGTIEVISEPSGALFTVFLPLG